MMSLPGWLPGPMFLPGGSLSRGGLLGREFSVGGEESVQGERSLPRRDLCQGDPPLGEEPVVRILLECFLV